MKKVIIKEILLFLDQKNQRYRFIGNNEDYINGFSEIDDYKENTLAWIKNQKKYFQLKDTILDTGLIIVPELEEVSENFRNIIITNNPKKVFFNILNHFYAEKDKYSIGKYNVISANAKINKNVSIGNNCTIEDFVEIGEGTKIYNSVIIKKGVKIGKNCIIKSGTIIGEEGFGHIENEDGSLERIPHLGNVVIEDNVDIGSNTCIDRGVLSNTIISKGSKIHNLCQIAHNVFIGKNCFIAPNTIIYGSVVINDNCYIGGSMIKNQINIGSNSVVGMGAVVVKDVEDNKVVAGVPARVIRDNL